MPALAMSAARPSAFSDAVLPPVLGPGQGSTSGQHCQQETVPTMVRIPDVASPSVLPLPC